jgi:uncharacterized membrane protein YidH (DUF202 family)
VFAVELVVVFAVELVVVGLIVLAAAVCRWPVVVRLAELAARLPVGVLVVVLAAAACLRAC